MRRVHLLLVLIVTIGASVPAQAQDPLPPIVTAGLEAYRQEGPSAALDVWLQGWAAETQKEAKSRLLGPMEEIVRIAGAPSGFDYLGPAVLGPHTRRVFVVLLHEQRPAFLRLDIYRTAAGEWRVLNVTVNTEPGQVFPEQMLVPHP